MLLPAVSLGGLGLMVLGLVGLLFGHSLFSWSPIVIVVQCASAALLLWARATFGRRSFHASADPTAGGLVTTGPYRFIRHPIYTAVCAFALAGVLAHWSWRAAALFALLFAGAFVRMLCEERLVASVYPEYQDYARVRKRMIPFVF